MEPKILQGFQRVIDTCQMTQLKQSSDETDVFNSRQAIHGLREYSASQAVEGAS